MKFLLAIFASAAIALAACPSMAQTAQANVVSGCGTPNTTYSKGETRPLTQDTAGKECVNATVSASVTGFRPTSTGTPISVTTGGVTGTLPAGAEVVATNVGTTNTAYCKLGASATTSDQAIAPGGWFAFAISGDTQLTCITSTSTTTVNMVGGSGLPTGVGGAGSSGGGGTSSSFGSAFPATGTAVGASDGTNMVAVKIGSQNTAASVAVALASDQAAISVKQATAGNLNATVVGTGTFAVQDSTTETNTGTIAGAVSASVMQENLKQVNGVTTLAGAGAVGTGAQRVAVGQDTTTIAGSAPGTAGTASANVVTIQGIAGMTKLLVTPDANSAVNVAQFGGSNVATGTGAGGSGVPRVTVSNDSTVGLVAGTALVGKVGIDQTTPGTTNAVSTSPNARTITTLDIKTVTTGGTAVAALSSGHKTAGGWIQNPSNATINLCINEIGTATGTTSSGDTTCIIPGQTYNLIPSSGAVSVISSDSSHPFSGYGLQ